MNPSTLANKVALTFLGWVAHATAPSFPRRYPVAPQAQQARANVCNPSPTHSTGLDASPVKAESKEDIITQLPTLAYPEVPHGISERPRRVREPGPLRILTLDGGQPGSGEFSQLLILRELVYRLERRHGFDTCSSEHSLSSAPLCDYFDIIAGAGIGGMIAILAVVFEMTIDEFINVYRLLYSHLFAFLSQEATDPISAQENLASLKQILHQILHAGKLRSQLCQTRASDISHCRAIVSAVDIRNTGHPRLFSTHDTRARQLPCTVLDALTMCLSDGEHLPPVALDSSAVELVGSAHRFSNPISATLNETLSMFGPSQGIACVVSIGAPDPGPIALGNTRQMALDCQSDAQFWEQRFSAIDRTIYSRFNVTSACAIGSHDLSVITSVTHTYMHNAASSDKLDGIAASLYEQRGEIAIHHILNPREQRAIPTALQDLQEDKQEEHLSAIREWLCPDDRTGKTLGALRKSRTTGTGEWFLETQEFRSWVDGSSSRPLFVLDGPPGVGKTYLSQLVYDFLLDAGRNTPGHLVLGHFIQHGRTSIEDVLGSLLAQSSETMEELPHTIRHLNRRCEERTLTMLESALKARLDSQSLQTVVIVVDALDELPVDDCPRLIPILRKLGDKVRLFAATRLLSPEPLSSNEIQRYHLASSSQEDIHCYVRHSLDSAPCLQRMSADLKDKIVVTVAERSASLILLTTLHMESLSQCRTNMDIEEELPTLPTTPEDRYKLTLLRLHRLHRRDRQRAMVAFKWAFYASQPLTQAALVDAVSSSPREISYEQIEDARMDGTTLFNMCGGLLRVVNGSVVFAHKTVHEFFECHQELFDDQDPHCSLASACLTYIVPKESTSDFPPSWQEDGNSSPCDYFGYCRTFGPNHARLAVQKPAWKKVLRPFIRNKHAFDYCCAKREQTAAPTTLPTPAHFLSFIGDHGRLQYFFHASKGYHGKAWGSLLLAAYFGHTLCIQGLLAWHCTRPDARIVEQLYTALMLAAEQGHLQAVKELLGHVSVLLNLNALGSTRQTALFLAVSRAQVEVVRLLLAEGVDTRSVDEKGRTSLLRAVHEAWQIPETCDIVSILVNQGVDVNAQDMEGCTALCYVRDRSCPALALQLEELGGRCNHPVSDLRHPIHGLSPCILASA